MKLFDTKDMYDFAKFAVDSKDSIQTCYEKWQKLEDEQKPPPLPELILTKEEWVQSRLENIDELISAYFLRGMLVPAEILEEYNLLRSVL